MARRQRLPSWVENAKEPKPPKPLRYRIDPTAEQADHLDKLLSELESQSGQMDADDYFDLRAILEGRQQALAKRIAKLKGPEPVQIDCTHKVPWSARVRMAMPRLTPSQFKWALGCVVVLWFIQKNI